MLPAQIHNLVKICFHHVEGACCLHLSPAKNAVFKKLGVFNPEKYDVQSTTGYPHNFLCAFVLLMQPH